MYFDALWVHILIYIFLAVFFVLSLKRPFIALVLLIFNLPVYLIRFHMGNFPTTLLEMEIYLLSVASLSNIFQLLKYLVIKLFSKQTIFSSQFLMVGAFLIFLGSLLGTIFSKNIWNSAGIFKGYLLDPFLVFLLVLTTLKAGNFRKVEVLLSAMICSGIAVSVVAIGYLLSGRLGYDGRLSAFWLNANMLAMYISPAAVLLFGRLGNWISFFPLGAILAALTATRSLGAFGGLLSAFLLLGLAGKLSHKRFLPFFRKIVFLLVLFGVLAPFIVVRIPQAAGVFGPSFDSRLQIWRSSERMLSLHPFLGVGPGNFQKTYLEFQKYFPPYREWAVPQPHNIFLAFWLNFGILGFLGFFGILIYIFLPKDRVERKTAFLVQAAVLAILVQGIIDTPYFRNDLAVAFWVFLAILFSLRNLRPSPSEKSVFFSQNDDVYNQDGKRD